ncbi:MAG: addiction module protein [Verrucomicrobia bacterium]|nr:addiction module protein [Verrucomicrobiota bacterium]
MPITLDEIVEETRQLPMDVVAELVDRIMLARHGGMNPQVEEEWKQEVRRRLAEHESGQGAIVSAEEMKARLRNIR